MLTNQSQQGVSVIELLIAMAAGLLILAATVSTFIVILKSNSENLKVARLNHELRSTMKLVASDIRRAGYWSLARNDVYQNTNTNPFLSAATDLQVSPDNTCILLSYDRNKDGTLPALNTAGGDKRFGYRVRNQVVQSRPLTHTTLSCNDPDGDWDEVTSSNVVSVTNLNFTLNTVLLDVNGSATLTVRNVHITLTGQLVDEPTITRTLTQSVRVRNDKFAP